MQVPGALEALEVLAFHKTYWAPGMIEPLAHALATACSQYLCGGCFIRLESINVGHNGCVTSQGLRALVRAVQSPGSGGLPLLSSFSAVALKVTSMGIRALARALIKTCPRLQRLAASCPEQDYDEWGMEDELANMVRAAGCQHRVSFYLKTIYNNDERQEYWEEEGDWTDENDWLEEGDNRILFRDGSDDDDEEEEMW